MDIPSLKLTVSPRAAERMSALGGEFRVVFGKMTTPKGPMPMATCLIGTPKDVENYARLESDGLVVWAPNNESFVGNEVVIDLYAVGGLVMPVALSAIVINDDCDGVCAHCASSCASRTEDEEF